MNALARLSHGLFDMVWPTRESSEPVLCMTPKPATGFFAHLTDEQKRRALSNTTVANHGDDEFRNRRKVE